MVLRILLILPILASVLAQCSTTLTPTPTAISAPTSRPSPVPTASATTPILPALPTVPLAVPTASPAATPAARVIARQEGSPVAILTLVRLEPGHTYHLRVTANANKVAFSGTWSQSAVGMDLLPAVKTGQLEGTTPAELIIVPPVALVAKDWVYSASAQGPVGSSIVITIVDVTP